MGNWYLRLSALICVLFLAQRGVSVTAELDRTTISTDELATLTLTIAGNYQQVGQPQLPLFDGFNLASSSRSSQFSMVNGVVTASTVFTYRLQPTGSGDFTIEPIAISVDGSMYQTDPISVQVVQGIAPTPTPVPPQEGQAPAPGGLTGQDVYVEADVDNPTPFVGQQIIYRFRFYQGVNLFNQPSLDWPSFSGFWTQDLSPNNVYEQLAGGRRYRVTEVRRALFPVPAGGTQAASAGQITIEPSTLTVPGDFFNRDIVLETQPVVVEVQALPPDAPDGFDGAVGQFEIEAWVEPTETRVNEPVTLRVRIAGAGNLSALPDPTEAAIPILPDWRVYDPQIRTDIGQEDDTVRSEKEFERLLVPKTEGDLVIPALTVVYFDPNARAYRQLKTEPLVIHVGPGDDEPTTIQPGGDDKQEIPILGNDIRHIKAAPPALAREREPLLKQPAYWLGWFAPLLAVAGVWVWERRRQSLAGDIARARARRAARLARKRLSQERKSDENTAYAAVAHALTEYVADKLNLPPAGLTRDAVRETLTAQAVPVELIERTLTCLDWADSGRFAPVAAGRDANELIGEAEQVIRELEQGIT